MEELECKRCSNRWVPRKPNPRKCPACWQDWRTEAKRKRVESPRGHNVGIVDVVDEETAAGLQSLIATSSVSIDPIAEMRKILKRLP